MCRSSTTWWLDVFPSGLATEPREHTKPGDRRPETTNSTQDH